MKNVNEGKVSQKYSGADIAKFIVPSILGIFLLMFPFQYEGETTILVALLAGKLTGALESVLPTIVTLLIICTGIGTIWYRMSQPEFMTKSPFLRGLFDVNLFWLIVRIIAIILALLTLFEIGPEAIWSEDTGGLILGDLILGLFSIFLFAAFLLPLLTDFGLLEYVGVILTPVMRPLFNLPGRSSVDCVASWIGDGTIGVTLTNKQYEDGYYTAKEASIIATTFSAVSITFTLVVLKQVELVQYFGFYYLTICLVGIVCAIIMPRIYPLRNKKEEYYAGKNEDKGELVPEGHTNHSWGLHLAVEQANKKFRDGKHISTGVKAVLDMWLGVLPSIMAFGTIALIIAESTPIFDWLGLPFLPILKLFQIPNALEVSQTMVVGFSDMFLPSVIGASVPSEMARFIIATMSVTQLVYLSEAGAVILGTRIPIDLKDLFIIFIERTIIGLPIICLMAHLIF
ncbi:MAG: YjiH family protein [Tissierellia bacterium]|nr:YjiH family protein [Tissierellia bacterium]